MAQNTQAYPISFRPILKEKVWGARNLAGLGKELPPGGKYGESWELADLSGTAKSGGGGGSARSVIANGTMAGRTLQEAMAAWGGDLLGSLKPSASGGFPLLIKFLDAGENLSVQVHPSPEYAAAHTDASLKTESWYILNAVPDAVIYKGVRPGVNREALGSAVATGGLVDLLQEVPVQAGDCHDLPSGTVHALGAGITVAEIQTPSDTTFRLYDWIDLYDRPVRELHVEPALESAFLEPGSPATRLPEGESQACLVRNEFYDLWELRLQAGQPAHPEPGSSCYVLMVLEGAIISGIDRFSTGNTVLVPAACIGSLRCESDARLLAVGFGEMSR